MTGAPSIASLVPQRGAMCLLGRLVEWDAERIACMALSHRDPGNPLRGAQGLPAIAGAEYGMQAAALHGALCAGAAQPPGLVAALRIGRAPVAWLDRLPGELLVEAWREAAGPGGVRYRFAISCGGVLAIEGSGTVALPGAAA